MSSNSSQPFYYENKYFVIRVRRKNVRGDWYVGPKKTVVPDIDVALQFSTADGASRSLAKQPRNSLLFEIEAITQNIGPISPLPDFVADLIERIPFPYIFIAHEWYCGGDVKTWLLTYRSKSTFYRYRKKLMEYGIDISSPSRVVLLGQQSYCPHS